MTNYNILSQRRKTVYLSVAAALVLFSVCILFVLMLHQSLEQKAALETTQRYRIFESKVERLIYSNIILLEGFDAYMKGQPQLDAEDAYRYLDHLLEGNQKYIRNIGVIEDTTVLWNYPRKGNSGAIGVDLTDIPEQRDYVLKVKESGQPLLQGPINLVQGDSGFSVRNPIFRDGKYWGQTSIVLKTDKLLAAIEHYAENANLSIAIYNQEQETPFYGPATPFSRHLSYDMDPSFINWRVHVRLTGGLWNQPSLLAMLLILSAALSAVVGVFLYQRLKANHKILDMSTHDHLTGLFNRHFLSEHQALVLTTARREKRKAAVLMLDLDRFKSVNDTYGHEVGDKALIETARILKRFTRAGEAIFRLGGDEFLILIPEIDSGESLEIVRSRLLNYFEREFEIPGYPVKMLLSIGYALFPEDAEDFDSLLREADRRLYREKAER